MSSEEKRRRLIVKLREMIQKDPLDYVEAVCKLSVGAIGRQD